MIKRQKNKPLRWRTQPPAPESACRPLLSLFAIPKPQQGETARIQANAIHSWARLAPHVEIFLFAAPDDEDLVRLAEHTGCRLIVLDKLADGAVPKLDDAFRQFHQLARGDVLAYANADMVFDSRLLEVADQLRDSGLDSYVAIGQRTDLPVPQVVEMGNQAAWNGLFARAELHGKRASVVCKDYFLFSRDMYRDIPAFLVGRGNWDNWMVHRAHQQGVPVIDLTARLPAIHQSHDYQHVAGGRWAAYVNGSDARYNERLAGGRHLWRGSMANWALTEDGPVRRRAAWLRLVTDGPRFLRLMRDLLL